MAAIGTTGDKLRGNNFFDVWEWGGRPGDKTSGSVDKALEAIRNYIYNVRDANAPNLGPNPYPARIHFRGSTQHWYLQRPCFIDNGYWEISGEGCEQTTIEGLTQQPCFIFGLQRAVTDKQAAGYAGVPLTLSPDHWVETYGILDTSAASAPGQRWGLRLKRDAIISCPLTPFSHGFSDGWVSIRQLTIDAFIDLNGVSLTNGDVLFGMGHPDGIYNGAHPFYLRGTGPGQVGFFFRTTGTNQPTNDQTMKFSIGNATGPTRITFQIDLAAAKAQAFVNNVQVAVTNIPATFLAANDMRFLRNDVHPFNIGDLSVAVTYHVEYDFLRSPDLTVYGLSMSADVLYQDVGVGGTQAYTPTYASNTFNDFNRYFSRSLKRIAFLPLQDPPPGNANCYNDGRIVSIKGGQGADTHGYNTSSCGYIVTRSPSATPFISQQNRIRDLTVINGYPAQSGANGTPPGGWLGSFGHAIALGSVYDMQIDNVRARSRGQAIGSLNTGANYTIHLNDVILSGGDAGYYGFSQYVGMHNYRCEVIGRTAIRLAGCNGKVVNMFFGGSQACTDAGIWIHAGMYGGSYDLENLEYDNEGKRGPAVAAIVCEGHQVTPTTLRISDLRIGTLNENAVAVKLVDGPASSYDNPSVNAALRTCTIDGIAYWGGGYVAHVQTDGTLWQGEVRDVQSAYGGYAFIENVPMIVNTGPGGRGRMVSRHRDYSMPPRGGTWLKNCHVLDMQLPVTGQYATVRCVSSGTYGTATPPIWSGSEVQDDGTNAVAAYAIDSTYIQPVVLS